MSSARQMKCSLWLLDITFSFRRNLASVTPKLSTFPVWCKAWTIQLIWRHEVTSYRDVKMNNLCSRACEKRRRGFGETQLIVYSREKLLLGLQFTKNERITSRRRQYVFPRIQSRRAICSTSSLFRSRNFPSYSRRCWNVFKFCGVASGLLFSTVALPSPHLLGCCFVDWFHIFNRVRSRISCCRQPGSTGLSFFRLLGWRRLLRFATLPDTCRTGSLPGHYSLWVVQKEGHRSRCCLVTVGIVRTDLHNRNQSVLDWLQISLQLHHQYDTDALGFHVASPTRLNLRHFTWNDLRQIQDHHSSIAVQLQQSATHHAEIRQFYPSTLQLGYYYWIGAFFPSLFDLQRSKLSDAFK